MIYSKMRIFTRSYVFQCFFAFLTSRWDRRSPLDRSKTSPRAIKKWCMFRLDFWLVLGSSWGRFGRRFGLQNRPKKFPLFDVDGLVFDLVVCWSQNGRQDRPKTVQEPPRAAQDPPNGRFGPFGGRLGVVLGSFGGRFGSFWGSIGWFDSSIRFNDASRRFGLLIRFVASMHWFDLKVTSIRFLDSLSTQQLRPAECAKRLNKIISSVTLTKR